MTDRERFLDTALTIGRRLCGEAIWHADRCNWLGDSMEFVENEWRVVHRACGASLYDGTSGIALFLARLARATGDRRLRTTARAALRHALGQVSSLPRAGRLGLYAGLPGLAYAARQVGEALAEEEWVSRGNAILLALTPETDDGEGLDVIGGAAGTIPMLLSSGDPAARELALALGERLLKRAQRDNGVASWNTMPTPSDRHLTGYSHGASGIALALLELGISSSDARFLSTATAGLAYERRHYVREHGNWPDFRVDNATPSRVRGAADANGVSCAMAWCHGAPGIGLARLRAYELTRDETARAEAEIALRSTRATLEALTSGSVTDFSLCHGAGGLAELFLMASSVLSDESHGSIARRVGEFGMERVAAPRLPWPCGVPGGGETPALLTGLAGIGYFYLRLALGDEAPSVLLLKPPE